MLAFEEHWSENTSSDTSGLSLSFLFCCCFEAGSLYSAGYPWTDLHSPGCPPTHYDHPASASQILGLQLCTTIPATLGLIWRKTIELD